MNLKQMSEAIAAQIGMPDTQTAALVASYLRTRYELVWNTAQWREAMSLYTIAVAADATHVTLRDEAESAAAAAWDRRQLLPSDQVLSLSKDLEAYFDTGDPMSVIELGRVGLHGTPAGGKLQLVSSNAADTAVKVTIEGSLADVAQREVVTLNGTTPVQTVNNYDLARALSKTTSAGTVTITNASGGSVLGTLAPAAVEAQHVRLRLLPAPSQAANLMVVAKRRCPPLINDSDVLVLRNLEGAVMALAHGDALRWKRQYAAADTLFAEGLAQLEARKQDDVWQAMRLQQVHPWDGVGACRPW